MPRKKHPEHEHEWLQGVCKICGERLRRPSEEIGIGRGGDIYLDTVDALWDIAPAKQTVMR